MSVAKHKNSGRFWLIVAAAATALLIFVAVGSKWWPASTSRPDAPAIKNVVLEVLAQYRVDPKSMRTRKISSNGGTHVRTEIRIEVDETFDVLGFNRDLNRAVAISGATVVATEKSEDKSVTMHVKKEDVIVQSIVLLLRKAEK